MESSLFFGTYVITQTTYTSWHDSCIMEVSHRCVVAYILKGESTFWKNS